MAPFDRMSECRRRRIKGSVVGWDDDIDVDFVAFVKFESAGDDDSVGFPSDDDNDGAVGCLGADGDSSAGRTTTLMGGCTWGELSNVAWSYAAWGACGPEGAAVSMMTKLVREATRRMIAWRRGDGAAAADILPKDAIQIAWALGTMGSDNGDVDNALVHLDDAIRGHWIDGSESRRPLAGWMCADLAQMATAMAHGRLDNQDVCRPCTRNPWGGSSRGAAATEGGGRGATIAAPTEASRPPKFPSSFGSRPGCI
jgi:hypothetical protein